MAIEEDVGVMHAFEMQSQRNPRVFRHVPRERRLEPRKLVTRLHGQFGNLIPSLTIALVKTKPLAWETRSAVWIFEGGHVLARDEPLRFDRGFREFCR